MKVGSREFFLRLQSATRTAIKANPTLRKAQKRGGKKLKRISFVSTPRIVAFAVFIGAVFLSEKPTEILPGMAAWWWLAYVLFGTYQLTIVFAAGPAYLQSLFYPFPQEFQWREVMRNWRRAAAWFALEYLVAYIVITQAKAPPFGWILMVLASATQSAMAFVAIPIIHRWMRSQAQPLALGVSILLVLTLGAAAIVMNKSPRFFENYFEPVFVAFGEFTPSGLVSNTCLKFEQNPGASAGALLAILVLCAILAVVEGRSLKRRMIQAFKDQEQKVYVGEDTVAFLPGTIAMQEDDSDGFRQADSSEIEAPTGGLDPRDAIDRAFLRPAGSRFKINGWFENLLWRTLTARDRTIAETIWNYFPPWNRRLLHAFIAIVLARSASAVFAKFGLNFEMLEVLAGGFFVLVFSVPLLTGNWRVLAPVQTGAKSALWIGFHPISYSEVSRVVLKIDTLRAVTALLPILVFALFNLRYAGVSLEIRLIIGILAWGAAFAVQPIRIALAFGFKTAPASHFRSILAIFASLIGLCVVLGAVTILSAGGILGAFVSIIVMYGGAFVFWWLSRRNFDHGRVDLLTSPE